MKIVVFGATGGTGRQVVESALAAGHEVTAVARKPEAIATRERLRVVAGDVLAPATLGPAVAGADAIVSAIGPANNKQPGTLISEGIKNLVAAAQTARVKRFVFESGLMLTDGRELSLTSRIGVSIFRWLNRLLYEDKVKAEATLRASDLDWVIVRPPGLVHGPATKNYVAGPLATVNAAKSLTHGDCGDCLVRAAGEAAWVRQVVNVGH